MCHRLSEVEADAGARPAQRCERRRQRRRQVLLPALLLLLLCSRAAAHVAGTDNLHLPKPAPPWRMARHGQLR